MTEEESEYEEFYISCNPPLLPNGVEEVFSTVKQLLTAVILPELLYEPDVPWFKAVALKKYQQQITESIRSVVEDIYDEDLDKSPDKTMGGGGLSIHHGTRRLTTWEHYTRVLQRETEWLEYRKYMFPETMVNCYNTRLWRGIERCGGLSIDTLFYRINNIFRDPTAPATFENFQQLMRFEAEVDMSNNTMYVGETEHRMVVDDVIRKLDNLVSFYDCENFCPSGIFVQKGHIIIPGAVPGSFKLSFMKLAQLRLDKQTYACSSVQKKTEINDEYELIMGGTTLRTMQENIRGICVSTKYTKSNRDNTTDTGFEPFIHYKFHPRMPEAPLTRAHSSDTQYPSRNMSSKDGVTDWITGVDSNTRGTKRSLDASGEDSIIKSEDIRAEDHDIYRTAILTTENIGNEEAEDLISFENRNDPKKHESLNTQHQKSHFEDTSLSQPNLMDEILTNKDTCVSKLSSEAELEATPPSKTDQRKTIIAVRRYFNKFSPILAILPGYINFKIQFGRIYLREVSSSLINLGRGPEYDEKEVLSALDPFGRSNVGFTPVLSTIGADADRLMSIRPCKKGSWTLVDTQTFYEFDVILNVGEQDDDSKFKEKNTMVIEVGADDFGYTFSGSRADVLAVYLHNTMQSWDAKICAVHAPAFEGVEEYDKVGRRLAGSIRVSPGEPGRVALEVMDLFRYRAVVSRTTIRQTARYQSSADPNCFLAISQYQRLKKRAGQIRQGNMLSAGRTNLWEQSTDDNSGSIPTRWVEACITSDRIEKILQSNVGLEFGTRTSWQTSQLEQEGILDSMYLSACHMLERMDDIGSGNNNRQGERAQVSRFAVEREAEERADQQKCGW